MQQQLVNFRIRDVKYDITYQFDINKKYKDIITFTQKNIGTIILSVQFEKELSGLIYCKIFQEFRPEVKRLVYNKPITNLLKQWEQNINCFYVKHSNIINTCIPTTDDEGNINGNYMCSCLKANSFIVEITFVDTIKQVEMDNIYTKVKQLEEALRANTISA